MSDRVDARNLECPQPVVQTKKALDGIQEGVLTVLVSTEASAENVRRFAESQGCTVKLSEKEGHTELEIVKGFNCAVSVESEASQTGAAAVERGAIVYVTADHVGSDVELGQHLLTVFIRNMLEVAREDLPKKIVFVNEGAKVPCLWEETIEDLKALEHLGVEILTCGVCLKHYDLMDRLQAGQVGNAFDTVQAFLGTDKVVNIC